MLVMMINCGRGGMTPLEHCYDKLQTQEGQTIESISYDGKSGVSKGNTQTCAKCQPVQSITKQQWEIFQAKIKQDVCKGRVHKR